MKTPAAWKAQLERSEGLVAGIFKLIDAFDSNDWQWGGNELNGNLLFDDGIAGAERGRTAGSPISDAGEQNKWQTKSAARFQSATIVAREMDSRKKGCDCVA